MSGATTASELRIDVVHEPSESLARLTYGRCAVEWAARPEDHIALSAHVGDVPVGLILMRRARAAEEAQLRSVAVQWLWRRQGIARQLLAAAERAAAAASVVRLDSFHTSRMKGRDAFEGLLRTAGWPAPTEHECRVAGRAGLVFETVHRSWPEFFTRIAAAGGTVAPWSSVSDAESAEIDALIADGTIDQAWSPRGYGAVCHPELGIVIRAAGRPVGWLFGEVLAGTDQVHYHNGFAFPGYQRAGWLIYGLVEVLGRQAKAMGSDSLAIYATAGGNRAMRAFIERRLSAVALWVEVRYRSQRMLGA